MVSDQKVFLVYTHESISLIAELSQNFILDLADLL